MSKRPQLPYQFHRNCLSKHIISHSSLERNKIFILLRSFGPKIYHWLCSANERIGASLVLRIVFFVWPFLMSFCNFAKNVFTNALCSLINHKKFMCQRWHRVGLCSRCNPFRYPMLNQI